MTNDCAPRPAALAALKEWMGDWEAEEARGGGGGVVTIPLGSKEFGCKDRDFFILREKNFL